jgi:hypothetical protein
MTDRPEDGGRPEHRPDVRHEREGVSGLAVAAAFVGTLVFGTGLALAAAALTTVGARALRPSGIFGERALPAPDRVADIRQTLFDQPQSGAALRERQRRELDHFGWVDRGRGLVRLPIGAAIDLVAKGQRP